MKTAVSEMALNFQAPAASRYRSGESIDGQESDIYVKNMDVYYALGGCKGRWLFLTQVNKID